MTKELSERIAIVTGGAGGLGRAIVEKLLEEGARVVIADVDTELGESLASDFGPDTRFRQTDVSDPQQVVGLVAFAVETFGGLHIMVNNAGVPGTMHASFLEEDLTDFQRVMSVNLLGIMAGTQAAARHMAANGGGSIVNISSIGGTLGGPGVPIYAASKAGVVHFTKGVAIDLAEHDIRVNCIAPAHIATSINTSYDDAGQGLRVPRDDREGPRSDGGHPAAEAHGHAQGRRGSRRLPGRRPVAAHHRNAADGRRRHVGGNEARQAPEFRAEPGRHRSLLKHPRSAWRSG
jgi:NAD(P)-dependent dehydrogenase (short-subunit alcohol dehydrogenase family)